MRTLEPCQSRFNALRSSGSLLPPDWRASALPPAAQEGRCSSPTLRAVTRSPGLPFSMVVAGSAAGALLISKMTPSLGRRRALAVGYLIGVVGAAMVIVAGSAANVPLALAGSVLLGPANAAVFLSRYAGADLVAVHQRGRALGTILSAAAVGAVIGPNLLGPADRVTRSIGLARFSGVQRRVPCRLRRRGCHPHS